jgi:hypothetical protein
MDLPGFAPWIKVKGISTGVPGTKIYPLVLELGFDSVLVGKWVFIKSIIFFCFYRIRKLQKKLIVGAKNLSPLPFTGIISITFYRQDMVKAFAKTVGYFFYQIPVCRR